ncbi:MAG: alcohol dehydrogenase catalytic domain-containing protein [Anaerolineaceae bacterium]|nr:alcohol dehydrogenase catalytic domain-containing protein [Anaerolineaceae bacterium]
MNKTMRAAVFHGMNDLRIEEVPIPGISPDEILIKVLNANICGTDLRILYKGHRLYPEGTVRIPGHEVAGEIAKVGENVSKYKVGDRVFIAPNMGDGDSRETISGNNNLDPNFQAVGINIDGAFAEFMLVPAQAIRQGNVMLLSEDADPATAAMIEPLACVLRGQNAVNLKTGDIVVVMGAGPMGILHMLLAKTRGAAKVVISEPIENRRKQALELGADFVVDPINEDLGEMVRGISDGRGADVIIVAAPSKPAQQSALQIAAIGGRINLFGGLPKNDPTIQFDSNIVHYKELVVTGTTACSTYDCLQAADLVNAGLIKLDNLVTSRFPLKDAVSAFEAAADGTNLRVSLVP